ncbi:Kinetochore protein Spc25 [Armadillidium nasatum]|uniref:Kinetochore protein SPC25 n=1 Tax=Armadillidium nasatum TaxID=96803 RepID=A0A5N5TPY3_9CRUS|nr:Kinetochore protein Spc25 [Armadillidium nasatum]
MCTSIFSLGSDDQQTIYGFNFTNCIKTKIIIKLQRKLNMESFEIEVRDILGEYKRELDFCTAEYANMNEHCEADLFESKEKFLKSKVQLLNIIEEVRNFEQEYSQQEKESNALRERINQEREIILKKATAEKEAKELDLITRCLGLRISRTNHNTLVFTFTQIQESDPERKYMVELCITEKNEYRLIQTVPPIKNLDVYEAKLNETNNFTGFLIFVRDLFSKMF